ncbi:MAG: hypothetical protein R3344_02090 [Acidobacteriota bacterium]|nr:hypothetical protein [Acidobacteriota bacterium]
MDRIAWLAATGVIGLGAALLMGAGRREARGEIRHAARLARRGGFIGAIGALGLTVVGIPALQRVSVDAGSDLRTAVVLTAALFLGVAGGFVGLLAGLSRKPRPSGSAAVILLTLSLGFWLFAVLSRG